jgi:hypothetical protein
VRVQKNHFKARKSYEKSEEEEVGWFYIGKGQSSEWRSKSSDSIRER